MSVTRSGSTDFHISRPRRSPARAAHPARATAMRLLKFPLLGRYVVKWTWPRAVDFGDWQRLAIGSRSGALLAALYGAAHGERKGVVVCAHPLRRDAKGYFLTSGRADVLRRNGFDVLLFDFNGFGESTQGDFNYAADVLAVAEYARVRAGGRPVHALAVCFGAIWTVCAATQRHPFNGIVVEAPLTSLYEYYFDNRAARAFLGLLGHLFPKSAAGAIPIEAARNFTGTPQLLVVGGTDDTITPIGMSRRLYEACTLPAAARSLWCVAGARHLRAFEAAPREYERRVTAFLRGAAIRPASVCC